MTEGVRPIDPVSARDRRAAADRRAAERRLEDAPGGAGRASASQDLVPVGEILDPAPDPAASAHIRPEAPGSAAAFAAQLIGQGGQRRGIKGGPPVMDAARSTYLGAEYSGERERRPPAGKAKSTDV